MNKSRQQYAPWAEDPDPPDHQPLDENKLEEYFREKERQKQD